jgi:hypothetical protein
LVPHGNERGGALKSRSAAGGSSALLVVQEEEEEGPGLGSVFVRKSRG